MNSSRIENKIDTKNVAIYIYYKEDNPEKKNIYWGFVRKLPVGGRLGGPNTSSNIKLGAVNTEPIFHGKWTSIDGKNFSNNKLTNNQKILYKLNEQIGVEYDLINDNPIDYSPIGGSYNKNFKSNNKKPIFKCILCEIINETIIFVLKCSNKTFFFKKFPINGITDSNILTESNGEIDARQSYTIIEMGINQETEITHNNNNYFTNYSLKNFIDAISNFNNYLSVDFSIDFKRIFEKFKKITINKYEYSRKIKELTHDPYIYDYINRKYKESKLINRVNNKKNNIKKCLCTSSL